MSRDSAPDELSLELDRQAFAALGRDDANMRYDAEAGSEDLLAGLHRHHRIDALIYQSEPVKRRR